MAHFAKLDENNIVIDIIVINNLELDPLNEEASGLVWLENWSGGYTNWKQTSYNNNFRKRYAAIGYTYDAIRDAFISPKPYPSWVLNEDTYIWEAPVDYPIIDESNYIIYTWDEETTSWVDIN
jgi:hypothetical protein